MTREEHLAAFKQADHEYYDFKDNAEFVADMKSVCAILTARITYELGKYEQWNGLYNQIERV